MKRKGIYSILSTFFFIIIIIIVAVTLIFFGKMTSIFSQNTGQQLEKYTVAQNARDRLYFCYGKVMKETNLNSGTCLDGSDPELNPELVKGYRIERNNWSDCTNGEWGSEPDDYKERFIYSVPVENGSSVCLGTLEVYI